ncbi:MAG: vWA domain-containing protein, partial [Gammaproteobacteria bacterium]
PEMLSLLLVLAPLAWIYLRGRPRPAVTLPSLEALTTLRSGASVWLRRALPWLRMLALALVVGALARPQWGMEVEQVYRKGIAIAMVVDISSSMGALDLELDERASNRLEVVKRTIRAFVLGGAEKPERASSSAHGGSDPPAENVRTEDARAQGTLEHNATAGGEVDRVQPDYAGRAGDLISMVTFARYADLVSPLTSDHEALLGLLERVTLATIPEEDGTAIGDGIASGIDSLRRSEGASRVMIVLTDGSNNAGAVSPIDMASAAKALGIRIYTIGAGTRGIALMPARGRDGAMEMRPAPVYIDEYTLEKVAGISGGKFFRATDGQALGQIYAEIDQLEKARQVTQRQQRFAEAAPLFLLVALLLLSVELLLAFTYLRVAPALEAR